MALTLTTLPGTSIGPVAFAGSVEALTATYDGDQVAIAGTADTIQLTSHSPIRWPQAAMLSATEIAGRVKNELALTALAANELAQLTVTHDQTHLRADLWISAESDLYAVALAVRSAVLLARVGQASVEQVRTQLASVADLMSGMQAQPIQQPPSASNVDQAAGVPAPPPAAPIAAAPTPPPPAAASTPKRFCPACGTPAGAGRFCTKCGTAL